MFKKKLNVWLSVITMQFDHAVLLNYIDLGQAVVNMVMKPWGPQNAGNFFTN